MKEKRILAMDFGTKRAGFAISDPMGILARPLDYLEKRKGENFEVFQESLIQHILKLQKEYELEALVLGLPRNMNGSLGPMAEKVQSFGKKIEEELDLSVIYWDERMTSRFAEKEMIRGGLSRKKRKKKVDTMAAQVLLQNYLDFCHQKR